MKFDIGTIKNLFKKGTIKAEKAPLYNPYRDWVVIFAIASVFFVGLFAFNMFLGNYEDTHGLNLSLDFK